MRPSHTLLYSAAVDLVDRHDETITQFALLCFCRFGGQAWWDYHTLWSTLLLSIWWTGTMRLSHTLLYYAAVDLVDRHSETITHFALLCCCRFGGQAQWDYHTLEQSGSTLLLSIWWTGTVRLSHTLIYSAAVDLVDRHIETITHFALICCCRFGEQAWWDYHTLCSTLPLSIWCTKSTGMMRLSHTLLYSAAVDLVDRHDETITHFALLCCCRFGGQAQWDYHTLCSTLLLSILWWTGIMRPSHTLLYSAAVDLVDRHNETITHFALLCCCRFGGQAWWDYHTLCSTLQQQMLSIWWTGIMRPSHTLLYSAAVDLVDRHNETITHFALLCYCRFGGQAQWDYHTLCSTLLLSIWCPPNRQAQWDHHTLCSTLLLSIWWTGTMRLSHTLLYSASVDLVDRHNETITHLALLCCCRFGGQAWCVWDYHTLCSTLLLSIWWTGMMRLSHTWIYSAAVDLVDRHNETITHFALLCCCRFGGQA